MNRVSDENDVLISAKKTLELRLETETQKARESNLQGLVNYVEKLTIDNKSRIENLISVIKEITEGKIEIERYKGTKSIFYDRVYSQIPMALALIHVATKFQNAEGDHDLVSKGSLIKTFYDSI